MRKQQVRLDQYTAQLWEKRRQETPQSDIINELSLREGKGLTSPASELPTEELKVIQENIMRQNLISMGNALPERKKVMMLRAFFKHKRNQFVEVLSRNGETPVRTLGKVQVIGRDFVLLTTLKDRTWLPYRVIESTNVPYGMPDVSSTHQHLVFDEELRHKLITRFGETVAKRDVLLQQFFTESLQTHLHTWQGTRVEVMLRGERQKGKILSCVAGHLVLKKWGSQVTIALAELEGLRARRWLTSIF